MLCWRKKEINQSLPSHQSQPRQYSVASPAQPSSILDSPLNMAAFFTEANFQGEQKHFPVGTDAKLLSITSTYKSVKVDNSAQVIAWQNHEHTGIFRVWTGPQSDITAGPIPLSRLVVADKRAIPVSFVFRDDTGGEPAAYSLKVETPGPDRLTTVIESNAPGDEKRLVAIIPAFAPPLNAFFEVSRSCTGSGSTLVAGPVAIGWELDGGWDQDREYQIGLAFPRGLPKQLRFEKIGDGSFLIRLVDNSRSEDYRLLGCDS
jgi:hypothetical protein